MLRQLKGRNDKQLIEDTLSEVSKNRFVEAYNKVAQLKTEREMGSKVNCLLLVGYCLVLTRLSYAVGTLIAL